MLDGTLLVDRYKQASSFTIGLVWINRQIGTTQHCDQYATVFNQSQTDRILLFPQETLGTIDGVEHPSCLTAGMLPSIDGVEDFIWDVILGATC